MAETSKNKIYYNDNENSVADVLADMKKMAESTDKAIENSKYNDAQIKKDISDAKKEQALKDAEQDNKIIELQNEKAELEKELKEAQEDFYQNSIRGQASGEYIHVEDSSNCRARIGIGGNHEQEMRSGKNYLNTLAKYKAGEKVTVDGITYIFNEDGSITCNGTATADSVLTFSSNLQTINGSGKKIVGMITGTQVPAKLSILAYTSDWSKNTFELLSSVNKNITINMQENIDYTIFRIIAYKGTTLNNQTIYYQILDTSVNDLTYEQYGASPSPDYQSEVESVGSNENMFNKDDYIESKLYINKNENKFSEASSGKSFIFDILKYNKLTISKVSSGRFGVFASVDYPQKDGVGTYLQDIATNATSFSYDFAKFNYLVVFYYSTRDALTEQEILDSIKLEKGTVATPYSPYNQGCVKVTKCNKNIFKPEEFSIINQNVTCSYKDGKFTLNGEVTSAFTIDISKHFDFNKIAQLTVNKNVTFSIQKYTGNIDFELNLGSRRSFYILQLRSLKKTKITKNLLEELTRFSLYVGVGKYNNFSFELQLEIGDNQTVSVGPAEQSYIMPTQQSFKSVRDIRDTFIKKDGKWYERHNIYRYLFTGNENFKALDNNSIFGMTVTENKAKIVSKNDNGNLTYCLSNRFVNNTQFNAAKMTNKIAFSQWSDTQYLYLSKIKDSVDELKSYLAANETYVDYPLETPIDIECTEEQSKILDELNNARTYKNVTNITTDSKAILSLDYAKDQETQNQKMQNEIDEIKQLLSTTQTSAMLLDNLQKEVESEVE